MQLTLEEVMNIQIRNIAEQFRLKSFQLSGVDMCCAHLCFPELGSCSHTMRLRPPVTHRWSPLPVVHAAKQRILGASDQVREARYQH